MVSAIESERIGMDPRLSRLLSDRADRPNRKQVQKRRHTRVLTGVQGSPPAYRDGFMRVASVVRREDPGREPRPPIRRNLSAGWGSSPTLGALLHEVDSRFDSLPGTLRDAHGRSVTRTRQSAEYVRHVVTCPGTSGQGRSISS